jgi:hypothetical protein
MRVLAVFPAVCWVILTVHTSSALDLATQSALAPEVPAVVQRCFVEKPSMQMLRVCFVRGRDRTRTFYRCTQNATTASTACFEWVGIRFDLDSLRKLHAGEYPHLSA